MRFLFYFIFLIVAAACGSKKTALTGNVHATETSNTQTITANHTDSTAHVQTTTNEHRDVNTKDYEEKIKIEFDTEKPLNNATGLPPVKSIEITEKGKKTAEKTTKNTEQANAVNYDEYTLQALNNLYSSEKTEEITEKTEREESQFLKWIMWIGIAAAAIFVCIIVNKMIKGKGLITYIKNLFK
jgi:hypothetical protein